MHVFQKACLIAMAGLTVLAASGCTNASADSAPAKNGGNDAASTPGVNEEARSLLPQSVRERGTLIIASDPTYAPFEYYDTDNKTMIGWDVDTGDALAAILGVKAQHVAATFETILPGLASKKYDVGMSDFGITDERKKIVDFVAYLSDGSGIAVAPGNPEGLLMTSRTLCGKKVAAQKGSTQSLEVMPAMSKECTDAGKAPIDQQLFPTQNDANLALISGRVDGVMADSISLAYEAKQASGKFELAQGPDYQPEPTGLALNKESGLKDALTAAMKVLVGSKHYTQINEKWAIPASAAITADQVTGK
ncbi:ABC transporter substrate-binding protein [Arthrobacter sp. NyZ413]|uniref:ABC transporter substrate-binding protein n=1 Tax=Arthrobacter sp. NyZ413 TaxID=3144669 RepID=UPI003BF886C3